MSATKKEIKTTETNPEKEADVLYQKMGDRWFAFSVIDDEVFIGSIDPEELEQMKLDRFNDLKK